MEGGLLEVGKDVQVSVWAKSDWALTSTHCRHVWRGQQSPSNSTGLPSVYGERLAMFALLGKADTETELKSRFLEGNASKEQQRNKQDWLGRGKESWSHRKQQLRSDRGHQENLRPSYTSDSTIAP